jgi:predicted acetyltransferase
VAAMVAAERIERTGASDRDRGGDAASLRLRPLWLGDEAAFVAAHEAMKADEFTFGLGYEPGMAWPDYIGAIEAARRGVVPPGGLVPATFLFADVGGVIVGRASIRHELNEMLAREGGHIGYGVLPGHRRRGYATEILRQALVIARSVGVDRVLVTCDDDNLASARAIERCGGALESVVTRTDGDRLIPLRRYWID